MADRLEQLKFNISRKNLSQAATYEKRIEDIFQSNFALVDRYRKEYSTLSLEEYVRSKPSTKNEARRSFHIQKLGQLSKVENQVIELVSDYIEAFFGVPVRMVEELKEDLFPDFIRQKLENKQILDADYVLSNMIADFVPRTSLGLITITHHPLYSQDLNTELMGCALLNFRSALWTTHKFELVEHYQEDVRLESEVEGFLKLAIHEVGHIFGLPHCEVYECIMGMVDAVYLNRYPASFCPACLAKLFWNLKLDERGWLVSQKQFWTNFQHSFNADFFEDMIELYDKRKANQGPF